MGNYCLKRKEKASQEKNVIEFQKCVRDVNIVMMRGNICSQAIDGIVNWTDCFLLNEHTFILHQAMNADLQAELDKVKQEKTILMQSDCFSTSAGKLASSSRFIIHSTLPLWRGGSNRELEQLEEAIAQCILKAIELNLESIGFTQNSADIFGIPLQEFAETIVQAFYRFAKFQSTCVKRVVFIHEDPLAIACYVKKLKNISGEPTDDVQSIFSDKLRDFYLTDRTSSCSTARRSRTLSDAKEQFNLTDDDAAAVDDFDDLERNSSHRLISKSNIKQ